jgi:hypothetical protein
MIRKEEIMNIFSRYVPFRLSTAVTLALVLLAGIAVHGFAAQGMRQVEVLADPEAAAIVGGLNALGVLALAASSVTVGLGGALVLSVSAHIGAAICLS